MSAMLAITYCFRFENGEVREVLLRLDGDTLALIPEGDVSPPFWTDISFRQCRVCTLNPATHPYCPVAVHLMRIVELFKDRLSSEKVRIEVSDSQRGYFKDASLQSGLGPLMGIIMVSAGCPVMNPLRPMVRFHLPFASMKETEFRTVSMYLMAQYFRARKGQAPDWSLEGLQQIYDRIRIVNKSFAERLRAASDKDAAVNAIVILDCFAKGVPIAARTALREYERHFAVYCDEHSPLS